MVNICVLKGRKKRREEGGEVRGRKKRNFPSLSFHSQNPAPVETTDTRKYKADLLHSSLPVSARWFVQSTEAPRKEDLSPARHPPNLPCRCRSKALHPAQVGAMDSKWAGQAARLNLVQNTHLYTVFFIQTWRKYSLPSLAFWLTEDKWTSMGPVQIKNHENRFLKFFDPNQIQSVN